MPPPSSARWARLTARLALSGFSSLLVLLPVPAQAGSPAASERPPPDVFAGARPAADAQIRLLGQGPDTHEHGVAYLQVAVAGSDLALRFKAPQDSLLGFEAAPRTERQRQEIKRMAVQFHRPDGLFLPTADAACVPAGVTLTSDSIKPALLAAAIVAVDAGAGGSTPVKEPAQDRAASPRKPVDKGHTDVTATVSFRCSKPQSLTGMQVMLFDAFPKIRQIDVKIVTSTGESGARLTPNRSGLTW